MREAVSFLKSIKFRYCFIRYNMREGIKLIQIYYYILDQRDQFLAIKLNSEWKDRGSLISLMDNHKTLGQSKTTVLIEWFQLDYQNGSGVRIT